MGVVEMQAEWWRTNGQRLETENEQLRKENQEAERLADENAALRNMIRKLAGENSKMRKQLKPRLSRKVVPNLNGWTLVTRK